MPWYAYLALKQVFPSGRKVSLQSLFYLLSVLGVTLGVFLLVVSQSIMGGYGEIWEEKIIATGGEVTVRGEFEGDALEDAATLAGELAQRPGVRAAAPLGGDVGMVLAGDIPAFPKVWGIDIEAGAEVLPVESFLVSFSGRIWARGDGVLISYPLARMLGTLPGDPLRFYSPLLIDTAGGGEGAPLFEDEDGNGEGDGAAEPGAANAPVDGAGGSLPEGAAELVVAGIYRSGWAPFDEESLILPLAQMQKLYGLGDAAQFIPLKLQEGADPAAVRDALAADLPEGAVAETWRERARGFLWILGFERVMVFVLTLPINLVGGFVIVCAQLLTVMSKTREIGLVAALGGTPRELSGAFLAQGVFIGACGSAFGVALALAFLHGKDEVVAALARLSGEGGQVATFRQFSEMPVDVSPAGVALIVVSALLLASAASWAPAVIAARRKPADALRCD